MNRPPAESLTTLSIRRAVRGIVFVVFAFAVIRIFPAYGAKVVGAALVALFGAKLFSEWKTYLRPTRTLYSIHWMRTRRFLKRLGRVPPDVPLLYGVVLMFALAWIIVLAFKRPGTVALPFENVLEWVLALGALRHGSFALRTIVRLTWSKTIGKVGWAAVLSVSIWLGRSDAAAAAREITHADAKYFPTFVGVMSGAYATFRVFQFCSLLLLVCAMLMFFASCPRILMKMWRNAWRPGNFGLERNGARDVLTMPDAIAFFTPVGLVVVAQFLLTFPAAGVGFLQLYSLPAVVLAHTEYVDDKACKNLPDVTKTQYIGGNRVSVLKVVGQTWTFSQAPCENAL